MDATNHVLHDPEIEKAAVDLAKTYVLPILTDALGKVQQSRRVNEAAERHSAALIRRITQCKTFLHPDKPQHIRRIYQHNTLTYGGSIKVHDTFSDITNLGSLVAIVGHAGSGKTLILKHLCFECIEQRQTIPVFIELRRLVSDSNAPVQEMVSILQAIQNALFAESSAVSIPWLELLMVNGRITVLLDGFDEIPKRFRPTYANELCQLSERFPKTRWVITTRPDDLITRIEHIHVLRTNSLEMSTARRHVDRYDVDTERQEAFKELLTDRLYAEHPTFSSNPLLLCVLFLTFLKYQRVEQKPHKFFEEVFEALLSRHDLHKAGFERSLTSGLERDEFVRFIELFCFVTAVREKTVFSRTSLLECLSEVSSALGFPVREMDLLQDLTQSISLMVEDGLDYSFIHRSLQEFLAVKYVLTSRKELRGEHLAAMSKAPTQSLGMVLLLGMDPDFIEETLVLPLVKVALLEVKRLSMETPDSYAIAVGKCLYGNYRRTVDVRLPPPWRGKVSLSDAYGFLRQLYPWLPVFKPRKEKFGWWHDKEDLTRTMQITQIRDAGLEYFSEYGDFGYAESVVGVDYAWVAGLHGLLGQLQENRAARAATRKNVEELIANVLDRSLSDDSKRVSVRKIENEEADHTWPSVLEPVTE